MPYSEPADGGAPGPGVPEDTETPGERFDRLAGIMALSTYVPLADLIGQEVSAMNRDLPIFMAHGSDDPVIPMPRAQLSRKLLESLGYSLEWHDYPMEHSVCGEEIADISAWLKKVLG